MHRYGSLLDLDCRPLHGASHLGRVFKLNPHVVLEELLVAFPLVLQNPFSKRTVVSALVSFIDVVLEVVLRSLESYIAVAHHLLSDVVDTVQRVSIMEDLL